MKKHYLFLFIVITFSSIQAQNYKYGNITDIDNQVLQGRISIDNTNKKIYYLNKEISKQFSFNKLLKVEINNRIYSKVTHNNDTYLAFEVIEGRASLYDLNANNYLIISEKNGGKSFNIEDDKTQIPGILGVLFQDCNNIRDVIYKKEEYNERTLRNLVSEYNSCDYSAYSPTETELIQANTFNTDIFRFYGGFQTEFNSTTINEFGTNNNTGFGLALGVAASPGFTGSLQGNLYFDFDFKMTFLGDTDFNNGNTPLTYKVNSYRLNIGLQYQFNKNGVVKPFVGAGFGFTSDHYNGTIGTISFKDDGKNNYFLPKAGVLYQLKNGSHLGLVLSYISEFENNLSFIFDDEFNPFVVKTTAFNLGLNYYF